MSYMNHTEFAPAAGIQELTLPEIENVTGAVTSQEVSRALYVVSGVSLTAASVAARFGAPQVAAGAAVIGVVAFVAAAAID